MKSRLNRRQFVSLIGLIFLLSLLPKTLNLVQTVQYYLSEATGVKANIVVDTKAVLGPMEKPWQALAQGGEEKEEMLEPVINEIRHLYPRYLRIDHLYDFYDVVGRTDGMLVYNWVRLDKIVDDILATGAAPFFSLSYMPAVISSNDSVSSPISWEEWSQVVEATVEHFSGRKEKNLSDVYYEVWNEPDLFGQWKIGQEPNYCSLYQYALLGASRAENVNSFKIGGPAITSLDTDWLNQFLDCIEKNNLRLDFISWHRYTRQLEVFEKDLKRLNRWLWQHPRFLNSEKIITEWGSDPGNHDNHDSFFDAVHTIAVIRQLLGQVNLAFSFEVKDGLDPEGREYWGRWGLLTHESFGKHKKPRYYALEYLNKLGKERLSLSGEGTWVRGLATKEGETIILLLVNYDPYSRHYEEVPLTLANLEQATYSYQETFLLGINKTSKEKVTAPGLIKKITLPPNSAVLIQLIKEPF